MRLRQRWNYLRDYRPHPAALIKVVKDRLDEHLQIKLSILREALLSPAESKVSAESAAAEIDRKIEREWLADNEALIESLEKKLRWEMRDRLGRLEKMLEPLANGEDSGLVEGARRIRSEQRQYGEELHLMRRSWRLRLRAARLTLRVADAERWADKADGELRHRDRNRLLEAAGVESSVGKAPVLSNPAIRIMDEIERQRVSGLEQLARSTLRIIDRDRLALAWRSLRQLVTTYLVEITIVVGFLGFAVAEALEPLRGQWFWGWVGIGIVVAIASHYIIGPSIGRLVSGWRRRIWTERAIGHTLHAAGSRIEAAYAHSQLVRRSREDARR